MGKEEVQKDRDWEEVEEEGEGRMLRKQCVEA